MADKNVGLIDNVLDVQCHTPLQLIPNHVLRPPSADELAQFRRALREWGGPFDATFPFEFMMKGDENKATGERSSNPADWKYWVVAVGESHQGALNEGLHELTEAARLTDVELQFRLQITAPRGISVSGSGEVSPSRTFRLPKIPLPFTQHSAQLVGDLHQKIKSISASHVTIYRAIQRYERLAFLEPRQPLYLLGVFAVIEAILTHDPEGKFDSLGHQIKKKMKLLNGRFDSPLDCSDFGGIAFDKLWARLYELRSSVAHGKDPDFTGGLQALKKFDTATAFVDQAAKKLLRHALDEPQLIIDLQDC